MPKNSSHARIVLEEQRVSTFAQELLTGEKLNEFAKFHLSRWRDLCPQMEQYSVDLAIVDGPWEVMDEKKYPRDHA